MSRYLGKVALITGGSQGLGKAFASALLSRGAKVSMVDISRQHGEASEAEFRRQHGEDKALFLPCDVTDKDQLEDAFQQTKQRMGGLDIVINNAGIADEMNWEKTIDIDLTAVIRGTYLGVKEMRRDGGGNGGVIINISSLAGLIAVSAAPSYAAAKHGVIGFTRSLAQTIPVEGYGIRFCCLCPSFAKTDILKNIITPPDNMPKEWNTSLEVLQSGVKLLGIMKPEEVVKGLISLLEEDRSHGGVLLVTPAGLEYKYPKELQGKL